jgi:mannosylglycerate hydrolase
MAETLKTQAESILRENDRGLYTIPSGRLYPHQWAWDSGFAAIGWAHLDIERACVELETLFQGQWSDGRIPHIHFHQPTSEYFPGPDIWGAGSSSSITNPPVWTLAAERLSQLAAPDDRVRSWLPSCEASHKFLFEHRDPLGWNVIATAHPWENGQDNCPAWDGPLSAIDPDRAPPFLRVDKGRVEDASQRPTDTQYKRYLSLVHAFRQNDFKTADFCVYDPFFTTVTILAEETLARLCRRFGIETEADIRAAKLRAGLDKLWSPEIGRYRYYDVQNEEYRQPYTIGSLSPLLLGESIMGFETMKQALKEDFETPFGLPTVAPRSPDFDPICYWRGPSWVNMNWLFRKVVPLTRSTLELVKKSGFWEYFHPATGKGLGADRFTWTAALVLDLMNQGDEVSR